MNTSRIFWNTPAVRGLAVFVAAASSAALVAACGGPSAPGGAAGKSHPRQSPAATSPAVPLPSAGAPGQAGPGPGSGPGHADTTATRGEPRGGRVPAGFQPQSVTFVSASRGWVLGAVPGHKPPASVVRTVDGGRTWQGIPAPRTRLARWDDKTGVQRLRFADWLNGWAYNPDLYVTHNGGATWHKLAVGGAVSDLETAGGVAYASVVNTRWTASLYRSQVGSDRWSLVAGVPRALNDGGGEITLHGRAAWLIMAGRLYATSDGASWHRFASPCPTYYGMTSLAAYDERQVTLVCTGNGAAGSEGKIVYASHNGGRTFTRMGQAPLGGIGGTLAMPSPSRVFLASSSGASFIYGSFDGGRTWRTVLNVNSGGMPWADLGFTTPVQGVAVNGMPGADGSALYMTRNSGGTWSRVRFTATLTTAERRQLATATLSNFKVVLTATRIPGNSPGPQASVAAAGYTRAGNRWKLIATKTIGKPGGWFWYPVQVCSLTITQLKPGPSTAWPSDTVTVSLLITPALGCSSPIMVDFGSSH